MVRMDKLVAGERIRRKHRRASVELPAYLGMHLRTKLTFSYL
jgi:hypothetical protein